MNETLNALLWILVSLAAVAGAFGVIAIGTRPEPFGAPKDRTPRAAAAPSMSPDRSADEHPERNAA